MSLLERLGPDRVGVMASRADMTDRKEKKRGGRQTERIRGQADMQADQQTESQLRAHRLQTLKTKRQEVQKSVRKMSLN